MFIISLYVFIDYQANDKVQFRRLLQWTWIENVSIFKGTASRYTWASTASLP